MPSGGRGQVSASGFRRELQRTTFVKSGNVARLAAGQVYLKVNFLLPWEVECSGMPVHAGGGEGMQRSSFRCVSGGLLVSFSPTYRGSKAECFSVKWKLAEIRFRASVPRGA